MYNPDGSLYQEVDWQGNPYATGTIIAPYISAGAATDGIFAESTAHILDIFYVVNGTYYDPFGYSGYTTGSVDGDWNSGYWLYVNVALYVVEQQVLLGTTYSGVNHNTPNSGGGTGSARRFSVLYQTYIAPEWAYGPPTNQCLNPEKIYSGDYRGYNPSLGSYRAMQQIVLGIGGLTLPSQPGYQDAGYSHLYHADSLDSPKIHILPAAYADTILNDCHYKEGVKKVSTAAMIPPQSSYSGPVASTEFRGAASDALEPSAPTVDWDATINLNETSSTNLQVSGTITHDCYPSHEISVGQTDVYQFTPANDDFTTILACLSGLQQINAIISQNLIIAPY